MDQVHIINSCLTKFCEASGQKVSNSKTRVFFSHNVNHNIRTQLSTELGFPRTDDLGKYLGVPLHHERVRKETYQYVVDKVRTRLTTWKANNLSFAGRNTLVKSVITAIPNYAMQTTLLPASCCVNVDKCARSFLWGSSSEKKKAHLVAWDSVCKNKKSGGLGIRHSKEQNKAFLMKLGWGLVTNRDALWTRVIRGKYKCGNDILPRIEKKRPGSRVWSSIKATWDKVQEGIETRTVNGQSCVRWKHEKDGLFSVRSAYNILRPPDANQDSLWPLIWKLKTPQRCKTLLWLVAHNSLMTNAAKLRRGLHPNGVCDACGSGVEDILHVFRDCGEASQIWSSFNERPNSDFWTVDLRKWIMINLRHKRDVGSGRWCDIFGILCWLLWKRRNERVFLNSQESVLTCIAESRGILRCLGKTSSKLIMKSSSRNEDSFVDGVSSEEEAWHIVRVDGACARSSYECGCGGVIFDPQSKIVEAFSYRIPSGDSLRAEIWGCLMGLKRAWDRGFRRVHVMSDSLETVELICSPASLFHDDYELLSEINQMRERAWSIRFTWVEREENVIADFFAKRALSMATDLQIMQADEAMELLRDTGIS